jgi:hypothetical protein
VCVCVCSTTLIAQSSSQAFWSLNGNSPQSGKFLGTINEQPLIFKSNSNEGFRLMPNGFLGIGTSNPTATLDVNGNVIFRNNLFVGGNIEFANSSGFIFPENYVLVLPILELTDYFKVGNSVIITANNHIYSSEDSGPLLIQSQKHDQNTLINWNNEGNVGIGTTNPLRKLHVRSETRLTAIPIDTTNFERNSIRIEHELFTGGGDLFSSSAWDISPGFRGKLHFFSANTNNNVLSLYESGNVTINNGRLGIGTDNPQAAIDISGDAIINGKLFANDEIVLGENSKIVFPDNYTVSFSDIELNNLAVGKTIFTDDNHIYTEENSGSLYIQSKEFDQNTIINLGNKGKVGIGTDNPQKQLHIYKEVKLPSFELASWHEENIVFDSIYYSIPIEVRDSIIAENEKRGSLRLELFDIEYKKTGIWDIEPSIWGDIKKLHFKNAVTNKTSLTLDGNGAIGIGTASPAARLHVHNGDIRVSNGNITTNQKIGIGTNNPSYHLHVMGRTGIISSSIAPALSIQNEIENGVAIAVYKAGQASVKLDNDGNACFRGILRASEVIIEQNFWCDYVFDNDYNLMSLKDVESFIKTNRHLPEIPPEAEVLQNGLSVGEMNALLLKKIEELTLYIIDQNKRLEELEKLAINPKQ